jgi:hypothetical protein
MAKEKPGGSAHDAAALARRRSMRGLRESYSDALLPLAGSDTNDARWQGL